MLIKLEVSAMADICIRTAREIQKCGQLHKSLLLKGKKKGGVQQRRQGQRGTERLQSNMWLRKKPVKGKVRFTGSSPNDFHSLHKTKRKPSI